MLKTNLLTAINQSTTVLSSTGEASRREGSVPLSISAQNVNSLNISSSLENWELKVGAIKKLGTAIIFISDPRLKKKDGFDIVNKLEAALLRGTGRKYKLWFNSSLSGRGVGILIAKDLDTVVEDGMEDENQNILALKCKIKNFSYVLVSIYGPNGACANFFNRQPIFARYVSGWKL
jgi:exonuclease III